MGRAERKRWQDNDRVRDLIKESETRNLDPAEINEIRDLYTGWGGLSSWSTGQFFTPSVVTSFVVDFLGIEVGSVLEASCGGGAFLRALPHRCDITGIELMYETAKVAQLCYPHTTVHRANALEMLEQLEERFDWAIGNPPFGKLSKADAPDGFEIVTGSGKLEWYFIELSYRSLKPGGMMALVIPEGILSNSRDKKYRKWFIDNAWIRAVISLPPETFIHVGTSVKTSVLVIQKPVPGFHLAKEDYQIWMAECKNIGWDTRRREIGKCDLAELLMESHTFRLNIIPDGWGPPLEPKNLRNHETKVQSTVTESIVDKIQKKEWRGEQLNLF